MRIAVLSDIHDRLDHLDLVLEKMDKDEGIERVFFLGDFCAPFALKALADGFFGEIDVIFGNNDGDKFLLSEIAAKYEGRVRLHGEYAELLLDFESGPLFELTGKSGRLIALNHYPEIGKRLAEGPAFDAVFSGHDHQIYQHDFEGTLWANPGEIMGRFGRVSYGVYDAVQNSFESVVVKG